MANHIFISYSRKDRTYTGKLADHLRGQGFEVWLDEHIDYGARWPRVIRDAIRACAAFVVVMTPDSEESDWVGREIAEAQTCGKPIYPLLRAGEVFFELINTQYVDVRSGKMPGPDLTARLVAAGVPRSEPSSVPAARTAGAPLPRKAASMKGKRRPAWLWAVGVLCVLVVAISGVLLGQWLPGRQSASLSTTTPSPTATTDPSSLPKEEEPTRPVLTVVPTPTPTLQAGATQVREKDGAAMVYVPAGEFWMGSSEQEIDVILAKYDAVERIEYIDEMPKRRVFVDAFWIDRTELTNAQYRLCVDAGSCSSPAKENSTTRETYYGNPEYDDYPVVNVTWHQARAYAEWVGGRLPTEAEWEYAARGPEGAAYPWGDAWPNERLLNCYNSVGDTSPVGSYPEGASWCGALDMSGNVWEWTSSLYQGYRCRATDGREDLGAEDCRVLRGGAWYNPYGSARCAARTGYTSDSKSGSFGFRVSLPGLF